MYFPFFIPQHGGKRSAVRPQTILSEFPHKKGCLQDRFYPVFANILVYKTGLYMFFVRLSMVFY